MEKWRKEKEKQGRTVQSPRPRRLIKGCFRVTDTWDQAILSNPATVACNVRGEKGGPKIEASLFIRSAHFGTPRPTCFPKISYPAKSRIHCRRSRPRSRALTQHSMNEVTRSVDSSLNGSRRLSRHRNTNAGVQSCRKHSRRCEAQNKFNFNLLSTRTLIHSGATDEDIDPG